MSKLKATLIALLLFGLTSVAGARTLAVVAAENFYGDIARQIGGEHVRVRSIINNPGGDPHLFDVSPSQARVVADADVVIHNGLGYDVWMQRLLAASSDPKRVVIQVADLVAAEPGDNPHLWYDPAAMITLAKNLRVTFARLDPAHTDAYAAALDAFMADLASLNQLMGTLRDRFAGTAVTATEPVFGPMAAALGLDMRNQGFQNAIMKEAAPSASQIIAFEDSLKSGEVQALIYNEQVTDPMTERLLAAAEEAGVPTIGVTETAPPDTTYQAWMSAQLEALLDALAG